MLKESLRKGFSFGLTSGIITTLGLMVGLQSGTHSSMVVLGGIITIAVADAFSDALGIHISEESESKHTAREIWEATFSTFIAKFVFALTFIVPVLLFSLNLAIWISIAWGLSSLAVLSYLLARQEGSHPLPVMGEHLMIAVIVMIITHYVGDFIRAIFV